MTIREIESKYKDMVSGINAGNRLKGQLKGRVNCYVCSVCGHTTKTRDVDEGVSPIYFECEKCGNRAFSTFYKDVVPDQEPTFEWFRPSLRKVVKNRKEELILDHVLSGGLMPRPTKN